MDSFVTVRVPGFTVAGHHSGQPWQRMEPCLSMIAHEPFAAQLQVGDGREALTVQNSTLTHLPRGRVNRSPGSSGQRMANGLVAFLESI